MAILLAGGVALLVALLGTPLFIRLLVRKNYGQFIREDGPTTHLTKRGTPTMGGVVIIGATLMGYAVANLASGRAPDASGLLLLFLMVGLGLIGFLDDYIKISKERSLGLNPKGKVIGQGLIGLTFSALALQFPNENYRTPASTQISFIRDTGIDLGWAGAGLGLVLFVIWANFLITAWSNAVNLTDGLDGLASGASMFVFGAYTIITIWQANQSCQYLLDPGPGCYEVRDPRDLAIVTAAVVGACVGFLWWNTSPAQIFMGDTGSLAIGAALATLALGTNTHLLLPIIGGLYVMETVSVILQVGSYRLTGNRIFRMAPIHHHFELGGWPETTVIVRFWLLAGAATAIALGIFYADFIGTGAIDR